MRYAIFSDVHSNLEALQAVLNVYKLENIDRYVFLGDIIGYGANPNETVNLLRNLNALCLAGNHDYALINLFGLSRFNAWAKSALLWTKKNLLPAALNFIRGFELIGLEANFVCTHGSLANPSDFNYINDCSDANFNFRLMKKDLCFVGHSHCQQVYILKNNATSCEVLNLSQPQSEKILLKTNNRYIINVGSVGQPRDGKPTAAFAIYDQSNSVIELKRIVYDIDSAAAKIRQAGLPDFLAQRLYLGK